MAQGKESTFLWQLHSRTQKNLLPNCSQNSLWPETEPFAYFAVCSWMHTDEKNSKPQPSLSLNSEVRKWPKHRLRNFSSSPVSKTRILTSYIRKPPYSPLGPETCRKQPHRWDWVQPKWFCRTQCYSMTTFRSLLFLELPWPSLGCFSEVLGLGVRSRVCQIIVGSRRP